MPHYFFCDSKSYSVKTIYTDHDCKTPKQDECPATSSLGDSRSNPEDEKDESRGEDIQTESHSIGKNRQFGAFMTPQPSRRLLHDSRPLRRNLIDLQDTGNNGRAPEGLNNSTVTDFGSTRYSIGGGEPRRMLVEMPWRVKDLVVPPKAEQRRQISSTSESSDPIDHFNMSLSTPRLAQYSTPKPARKLVDEQERKVITLTRDCWL